MPDLAEERRKYDEIEDQERRKLEKEVQERRDPYRIEVLPTGQVVDPWLMQNGRRRRYSLDEEVQTESKDPTLPRIQHADEFDYPRHHKHGGSTRDQTAIYIHQPSPKKLGQMPELELSRPRAVVIEERPRTTYRRSNSRPTIIHQGVSDSEWRGENSPPKSGWWNTLTGGIMS